MEFHDRLLPCEAVVELAISFSNRRTHFFAPLDSLSHLLFSWLCSPSFLGKKRGSPFQVQGKADELAMKRSTLSFLTERRKNGK